MDDIIDAFTSRFPFFDAVIVGRILPFLIDEYKFYYNHDYKGAYKTPILYCLAHMFYLETQVSTSQIKDEFANLKPVYPMNSEQMGDLSASYDIAPLSGTAFKDYFKTTQYGQRFLSMIEPDRGVSCV